MLRSVIQFTILAAAVVYVAPPVATQSRPTPGVVLYEGARLIPGDGTPAIEQSAFLVEKGLISRVGAKGSITAPSGAARVDLSGKTVMPTIINTHGHPGFQRGLTYSADNFTRESVIDDLNRALYFGIAAVMSQGIEKGDVTFQVRAEQAAGKVGGARLAVAGRGIGAPNAGPGGAAYAGIAYEVTTEEQSRRAVQELAAQRVDVVKIWVDDRNGRAPRLPPNLFRAIIDEGHKHGMKVNAHVFYYTDAVDLVDAGVDGLAHLVRDKEMDAPLVAAIVKKNVYVMPNLSPEWSTYTETPHWLRDGDPLMTLLQASTPPAVIARMKETFTNTDVAAVQRRREQYAHPAAEPGPAQRCQRPHRPRLRHRPAGSPVRHGGAAGAREHEQGGHVPDAGDRRRHQPPGRVHEARRDGNAGCRQGGGLPRPRWQPAGRHHEHAADFQGLHQGRRDRSGGDAGGAGEPRELIVGSSPRASSSSVSRFFWKTQATPMLTT